jgi:hypothetical protein
MKKISIALIALFLAGALVAPPAEASKKERSRFHVLVVSARNHKEEFRLTLPLSIVEAIVRDGNARVRVRRSDCQIDLRRLLSKLKRGGAKAKLEIREDGKVFKVWLD